jgi:anthranilate phosphoribosyltransferase
MPADLHLDRVDPADIYGGATVEEAASVFINILEGKGSRAQNDVVTANAALALYCMDEGQGMDTCLQRARESLEAGKALEAFKQLVEQK